jgi:hypothetical protein
VAAIGARGYLSEIYDNVACGTSCFAGLAPALGTPVTVTAGATTPGINLALDAGGRIRGRISQDGSGQPLANAFARVADSAGRVITAGSTDTDGQYTTNVGLPSGTYFVSTQNFTGHVNEIFDNKPCADNCVTASRRSRPARPSR